MSFDIQKPFNNIKRVKTIISAYTLGLSALIIAGVQLVKLTGLGYWALLIFSVLLWTYFNDRLSNRASQFDELIKRTRIVIIMRGAQGAGKSTYVEKQLPPAKVCSADHFYLDDDGNYNWSPDKVTEAHEQCKASFVRAIKNNEPLIIVDNTNIKIEKYSFYVEKAKEAGYQVFQLVMDGDFKNVHNVPQAVVDQARIDFERDPSLPSWTA